MPDTAPFARVGHLCHQAEQPSGNQRSIVGITAVLSGGSRLVTDEQDRR
jgi:hypothetical protein